MNTLKAEKRSMDVKAKRLRREGYVTGNVFGREIKGSIPVKMDKLEVDRILAAAGKGSQVMLDVEGEKYDVLIKEIDYNTLTRRVEEIDFQAGDRTEKVLDAAGIARHGMGLELTDINDIVGLHNRSDQMEGMIDKAGSSLYSLCGKVHVKGKLRL